MPGCWNAGQGGRGRQPRRPQIGDLGALGGAARVSAAVVGPPAAIADAECIRQRHVVRLERGSQIANEPNVRQTRLSCWRRVEDSHCSVGTRACQCGRQMPQSNCRVANLVKVDSHVQANLLSFATEPDEDEAVFRMEAQQVWHSKDDVGRSAEPEPWDVDGSVWRGEKSHASRLPR
jgi:hypothetical protein